MENTPTEPDASSRFEDSLPTTSGAVLALLGELGVEYTLHEHPPLRTVEDSRNLRPQIEGTHIKNLYLRDNKKRNFLVVAEEAREIDLKALGPEIGGGRMSFGSADRLMEFLGVRPGAVTPLALVNDPERRVHFAIDRTVLAGDRVNLHPLVNDKTVTVPVEGLKTFLRRTGHWDSRAEFG